MEVEEVAAVKEQEASDMVPLLDRPLLVEAPRGKLPSEADTISQRAQPGGVRHPRLLPLLLPSELGARPPRLHGRAL